MLRAASRIRRRLLGPGPGESRLLPAPALVALFLLAAHSFVLRLLVLALHDRWPAGRGLSFLLATPERPLPIRTALLLASGALIGIFGLVFWGWLQEARTFGWEAYRPWRLAGGAWAVFVLAPALVVFLRILALPGAGAIVDDAEQDLLDGRPHAIAAAVELGVPGAKAACRRRLASDDAVMRLFAGALLYRHGERDEDVRAAVRSGVERLALRGFGAEFALAGEADLRAESAALLLAAAHRARLSVSSPTFGTDGWFWAWWEQHGRRFL